MIHITTHVDAYFIITVPRVTPPEHVYLLLCVLQTVAH
jgi:hypothetical protein